jgi:putative acetyltransferase
MAPHPKSVRSVFSGGALEFRREDLLGTISQTLIKSLNAELEAQYPEEGANFFRLDPEEVAEGRGVFFVAYLDGEPAGCGAVRLIEPGVAEIKRMYVAPSVRGQGIGGRIVAALEAEAIRLCAHRILLETGPRQPDAIAMYERCGFAEIPLYGEYIGSNFSVCMAKNIESPR